MSGRLLLLPVLAAVLSLPALLVVVARRARPDHELAAVAAAARRHAVLGGATASVVGLLVLVLGLAAALDSAAPWVSAAVPATAGMLALGVLAVVETTWPQPAGAVRQARLVPRSIWTVAGRARPAALATVAVLTWVVVAVGAVLADGSQRAITVTRNLPDGAEVTSTSSPFPGLVYGGPAALAVAALLLATWGVLRLVVRRPALPTDQVTDDALRRASAWRVLRTALAGTLLTLGPLLLVGAIAGSDATEGTRRAAATTAAAVAGAGVVLAALVVAVWPATSVPRLGTASDDADGAAAAVGRVVDR